MPYSYTVKHAFAHRGVWYTRRNQDEVATLPRAVRDPLIEQGKIVEHHHVPAENAPEASPEPVEEESTHHEEGDSDR